MRLLLLAELRFLARAPWSAATAVLGVAIAVASIVAVHQIGAAVSRSLDDARPPHLAGITHLLERPGLSADAYFELRDAWRTRQWPGVVALVPIVEGYATVLGQRTRVLGADWLAYPGGSAVFDSPTAQAPDGGARSNDAAGGLAVWRLLDGTAVVADRQIRGAAASVAPQAAESADHDRQGAPPRSVPAAGTGLAVGDAIVVADRRLEVVGLVDGGLGPTLFTDIATAQRLLARDPEAVDYIGLAARDTWSDWRGVLDALMPGFAAGLPAPSAPPELRMAGFDARAIGTEQPAAEFARAILFNVGALGLLALLVAWFLVHQVALIWVERQRPVFARLHALGAAHGALCAGFVGLFALLGALATLLGTWAGFGLAEVLIRLSAPDGGGNLLARDPEPILLLKAAASGIGICVAGGWLAFRSDVRGAPGRAWLRPVAVAIFVVMLAAGLLHDATGLIGGFAAILAVCGLVIVTVRPLLVRLRTRLGRGAPRDGGAQRRSAAWALLARLAVREAVWRPEVVGVALAALALAVATSMGVGLMVESLRVDFARMLETRLGGDLYVRGPSETVAGVLPWLVARPEVSHVAPQGETRVRVARADASSARPVPSAAGATPSGGTSGSAGKPSSTQALLGYGEFGAREAARYGHDAPLASREILVNERLARELDLGTGATVKVGDVSLRVVGVFQGFGDTEPRLVMGADGLAALGISPAYDRLSIVRADATAIADGDGMAGTDPLTLDALSAALAERFPTLEVTDRVTLRSRAFQVFDRTFSMTRALTLLALLVAGVGVYNALMALRLAQAPTRRLLEAQGVAAWELGRVTLIRSATVGLLAVGVALPLGIAMAWLLCRVVNPRAFGWTIELHLVPAAWLTPLVLGLVATVLAGMLPAPRERGGIDESG